MTSSTLLDFDIIQRERAIVAQKVSDARRDMGFFMSLIYLLIALLTSVTALQLAIKPVNSIENYLFSGLALGTGLMIILAVRMAYLANKRNNKLRRVERAYDGIFNALVNRPTANQNLLNAWEAYFEIKSR